MTEDELRAASDLIGDLYKRRSQNWLPILAYGFENGAVTWTPKAEEGNRPRVTGAVKLGVWGGAVKSYDLGFNQQPCELLWAGIDVDAKGDQTYTGADLPGAVATTLPEAMVRRSSSGLGAHVFLHLENPAIFPTKSEAQSAAQTIARPYVDRLAKAGIKSDIVGRNQLWVLGGKQSMVQLGSTINPEIVVPEAREIVATIGSGGSVPLESFGPMCRRILETLELHDVIKLQGGVSRRYLCHIVRAQEALGTIPWLKPALRIESTGKRLDEPNSILSVQDGFLMLWTFVQGGRTVFKFTKNM